MKKHTGNGAVKVLGIDLSKQSFQIHGVDANHQTAVKTKLTRSKVSAFIANLPPCLIGMEACGGANHWVRVFTRMGHTVRMMAPQFVKPYVKSNKNDAADAEAICEAVQRPSMRFVPAKSLDPEPAPNPEPGRRQTNRAGESDPGVAHGVWHCDP